MPKSASCARKCVKGNHESRSVGTNCMAKIESEAIAMPGKLERAEAERKGGGSVGKGNIEGSAMIGAGSQGSFVAGESDNSNEVMPIGLWKRT